MRPRRGEVWWGEEPERERRPYLVLTRNSAIGNDLLMMPLSQLTERQCELSPKRMAEVCAALGAATEC